MFLRAAGVHQAVTAACTRSQDQHHQDRAHLQVQVGLQITDAGTLLLFDVEVVLVPSLPP